MNKLEVGMYVRTEDGHIDKIVKVSDEMKSGRTIKVQIGEIDNIGGYEDFVNWFSPSHFIGEPSFDIIDIVQVGDYVNGYEVEFVDKKDKTVICYTATFEEEEINSIVTKEKFESMKYEVSNE